MCVCCLFCCRIDVITLSLSLCWASSRRDFPKANKEEPNLPSPHPSAAAAPGRSATKRNAVCWSPLPPAASQQATKLSFTTGSTTHPGNINNSTRRSISPEGARTAKNKTQIKKEIQSDNSNRNVMDRPIAYSYSRLKNK